MFTRTVIADQRSFADKMAKMAEDDLPYWRKKIRKAAQRGAPLCTGFQVSEAVFYGRRGNNQYCEALQRLLGPGFTCRHGTAVQVWMDDL